MNTWCNHCWQFTLSNAEDDCVLCDLSKTNGAIEEGKMKLEEKMKKFKTVTDRGRCPCGNLWFFARTDRGGTFECTTCGRDEFHDLKLAREKDERENEERRRRHRESDEAAAAAIAPSLSVGVSTIASDFGNTDFSSPGSDNGWSGGGGDFSGGGASGEW